MVESGHLVDEPSLVRPVFSFFSMDERSRMNHLRGWGFLDPSISGNPMLKQLAGSAILGPSATTPEHTVAVMLNGSFSKGKTPFVDAHAAINSMGYNGHPWAVIPPTMGSAQTPQEDLDKKVKDNSLGLLPQEGDEDDDNNDTKPAKKRKPRASSKASNSQIENTVKTKKPRKKNSSTTSKEGDPLSRDKSNKRIVDIVINGETYDISSIPVPVCSCTGIPHQCYKWGVGGWQSSCCTKTMSVHPLPHSNTRPGARIAGRKMSNGAYLKVLEKEVAEGCDLSISIDLKNYWAKHGTNKFTTIR